MATVTPDIEILVGNTGGASPDAGSAKLIRDNLETAFSQKAVEIKVNISSDSLEKMRKDILEKLTNINVNPGAGGGGGGSGGKGGKGAGSGGGGNGGGPKTPNAKFAEQQLLKLKKTWETLQASFNRSGLDPKKVGIDALDAGVQNLIGHLERLKNGPGKASDALRARFQDAVTYLSSTDLNTRQLDTDPTLEPAQNAIAIRQNLNALLGKALSMTEELTGAERVQIQEYLKQLTALNSSMSSYQSKTQKEQLDTNRIVSNGKLELSKFNDYLKTLNPRAKIDHAKDIAGIQTDLEFGIKNSDVKRIRDAEANIKSFKATMRQLGYEGGNAFTMLQSKMRQFIVYSASAAVTGAFVKTFRQMISTVKELDAALTDLRIVTGGTKADTEELLGTYTKLAKSLGTTTVNVAAGATDWLRQGFSEQDAEELLKQSMTLSIVGDMESVDATTALTAALKGYQLQVEDASGVVDKFFQIDMEAATSSAKLATALAKTAANAKLAGLSLDAVISHLAVVNETMQEAGEETGTFYNTMLSRIGSIKAGRLTDPETGEDLSNVETVLKGQGINLRDQSDQFRNFGDVLADVAARWKDLESVDQRAIASAFAGTKQQTRFLSLMQGWGQVEKYITSASNSTGVAAEKLGVYQESIEAKANKMTAAFEGFATSMLDSDLVGLFYDLGTIGLGAADALSPLIQTIGFLVTNFALLPGALNMAKEAKMLQPFIKSFKDLGWPEMTGDNIVPIFSEKTA